MMTTRAGIDCAEHRDSVLSSGDSEVIYWKMTTFFFHPQEKDETASVSGFGSVRACSPVGVWKFHP
jgi:hypothetical protein